MSECGEDLLQQEDSHAGAGSDGSGDNASLEPNDGQPMEQQQQHSDQQDRAVEMAGDDDGLTLGAGQAPAGAESRGGGGTAEQLPEPPGSEDRHDETRPPPLHLESRNSAEPPPASAAAAADAAGAGGDGAAGGRGAHVDVSVFKYQPGVQTPMENFQNYRINLRGAALTGGLMAPATSSAAAGGGGGGGGAGGGGGGGAMSGTVDIVGEYERRKGTPVERHFIKDHRAKQLLVVPNDDKFVAVAAPEAFSRHSGTCMILGGQGAYSNGPNKAYELRVGLCAYNAAYAQQEARALLQTGRRRLSTYCHLWSGRRRLCAVPRC